MRIKIVRIPHTDTIDGIDFKRFIAGQQYEVGTNVGAMMLAEGWAEPVADNEPELLVPFSDSDPFMSRVMDRSTPPNLVRETYPPYSEEVALATDLERRKRRRRRK
jgi:hypothetical protein